MVAVKIPKPDLSGAPVLGLGKVFVLFDNKEYAANARISLHGRLFDNRPVDCAYMPEGKFLTGMFATEVCLSNISLPYNTHLQSSPV